jgi:hypothetical protein
MKKVRKEQRKIDKLKDRKKEIANRGQTTNKNSRSKT